MKLRFALTLAAAMLGSWACHAAPAVSSFSPVYGSSTDPGYIIINGSGFHPGTLVVRFNGVQATTAAATTATTIQARVPAAAPLGSGPIFVSVNGVSTLSAQDFTVIGPGPYITGFSPAIGAADASVTINGTHFTGATTVQFNGVNAKTYAVNSDSQITATAPTGVTTGPITVGRSGVGTNTTVTNFFVPPNVSSFLPNPARTGTNLVISGQNLLGATEVRFNPGHTNFASFTVVNNTTIHATVPPNVISATVRVTAPAGSFITSTNFRAQPAISGFSPGLGTPGTSITIFGANLNEGLSSVQFNGVNAVFTTPSFGQVTATVPANATTGPISVTTTNGTALSTANFYLPATITGITPNAAAPGTFVTITGTNFTDASAVTFNGLPAFAFFVTNNTAIGAIVPIGVTTGPVAVTTPAGTATSAALFYVPPIITGFTPIQGLPGTNVTIFGTNFLGTTAVQFNDLDASTFTVVNNGVIQATVPVGASTGPITVIAPAGTNTTTAVFTLDYTSDLVLTVTDAPDPVFVSSNLTYTIVVVNNGPFNASNVVLNAALPASAILTSATTTHGTLDTNSFPVIGALGTLVINSPATVTFTVVPQIPGTITNSVSVSSDYPDPVPANNTRDVPTLVLPLPLLSIDIPAPNRVRVAWPLALTNYALQFKHDLASTNTWSNVLTAPLISGNERVVIETNTAPSKFYRLRQ